MLEVVTGREWIVGETVDSGKNRQRTRNAEEGQQGCRGSGIAARFRCAIPLPRHDRKRAAAKEKDSWKDSGQLERQPESEEC